MTGADLKISAEAPMLVDTHTHLYLDDFAPDCGAAVERALAAGVGHMIFPNVGTDTIAPLTELHRRFPAVTSMAMGLHPTEVGEGWRDMLATVEELLSASPEGAPYVAAGEIGIDLYWDATFADEQMKVFDRQCELARSLDLPVIIHCRNALDPTLEVLSGHPGLCGVMHSFGGKPADVERVRAVGDLYFGLNGIITFKNARLDNTIREITPERILLETDSPYLAPVPHRGSRNESAYLVDTARYAAATLDMTPEALAATTTANASRLFRLKLTATDDTHS